MWRIQCAWCRRFKDGTGRPIGQPAPLDPSVSHGICSECRERLGLAAKRHGHAAIHREPTRPIAA